MERRVEGDQPETRRSQSGEYPDVDVLRMQAQASSPEPRAVQEPQRRSQEEGSFFNQIYHLLQYYNQEIEQPLEMGDQPQQSPHPERLTEFGQRGNITEGQNQQQEQETPTRMGPLPQRERMEMEKIVGTVEWESKEVQDALGQLMQKTPGTTEWDRQAANFIYEYQEQLEKMNEIRAEKGEKLINLVPYLDTISDALKSGGSFYTERERAQQAEDRTRDREALRARKAAYRAAHYRKYREAILARQAAIRARQAENRAEHYRENRGDSTSTTS
jgi:hypothetical protein